MSRARSSALALAAAIAATGLTAATASAAPPQIPWTSAGPTENPLEQLVWWNVDQTLTTFKCGLDDAKPVVCGSPFAVTASPGRHTFHITARNQQGETSTKDIDLDFVDTKLSGPAEGALVNSRDVKFTASSGYPGAVYECVFEDSNVFQNCGPGIELKNLSDGPHVLIVRAHGGATWDRQWVVRHFTVDTTPPDTKLSGDKLSSDDPGATFECRVDGGAWTPCTSIAKLDLAPGYHLQEARAVDKAGNADPTPVRRESTVAAPPAAKTTAPAAPAPQLAAPAAAKKTTLTLGFRYIARKTSTKFTRLNVLTTPGTKVSVVAKLRAKKLASWSYTAGSGSTSLKPLLGKSLKPGTKITIQAGTLKKTVTIRARRAPKVG
jgi:large repetitive protein